MAAITLAEVKQILRLDKEDEVVDNEAVTLTSLERHRLAYKGDITIAQVRASTVNTTLSSVNAIYTDTDYYSTKDYAGYTLLRRRPDTESTCIAAGATVYVSYTYNQYDDLIEYLIPIVERDVCEYLQNWFEDMNTSITLASYKFTTKTSTQNARLTDTANQDFVEYGFESGMDVVIRNTYRNSGIYHLNAAAASYLEIGSTEDFTQEGSTDFYAKHSPTVRHLRWPVAIKPLIAYIIWYNIERSKNMMVGSHTLGQNTITYEPLGTGNYPPSITNGLRKFKYIRSE